MKKNIRKILTLLFFVFNARLLTFGQNANSNYLQKNVETANQRTALRCLNLANNYLSEKNYNAALSQVSLGLEYAQNISDLWYVLAYSQLNLEKSKAEVLENLEKSLDLNNWVEYNKDSARIFYADILCDTLRFAEVFDVLDSKPMLYSSDAEYIRAKAYYRLGDENSVQKAREKIDVARRIYSDDTRFPLLFFKFENPQSQNQNVIKISEFFVNEILQNFDKFPDENAELEIYASLFAKGEIQERLLKSFQARNLRHPLFAIIALQSSLISEKYAFDYFVNFADDEINLKFINEFLVLLTEPDLISQARDYFIGYSGVIVQDTDGDGLNNLYVKYSRGRPETIFYDKNQDGKLDWNLICDFGVPINANVYSKNFIVTWKNYPSIETLKFPQKRYSFVNKSLEWTPVNISSENDISKICSIDFFYPIISEKISEFNYASEEALENLTSENRMAENQSSKESAENLTENLLISCASYFEIDSKTQNQISVRFILDNGNIQSAIYFKNQKIFAQAQFENNLPVARIVDFDDDGIYETTEFYELDKNRSAEDYSLEDEKEILASIFAKPETDEHFYLKLVQVDLNKNSIPDFTEEYFGNGGKISSWDTDEDGNWNVRYVKYPQEKNDEGIHEILREESFFYTNDNKLVKIESEDGIPLSVSCENSIYEIHKDSELDFYWIGNLDKNLSATYYTNLAEIALNELAKAEIAQSILLDFTEQGNFSLLCIKISDFKYGFIIPNFEDELDVADSSDDIALVLSTSEENFAGSEKNKIFGKKNVGE